MRRHAKVGEQLLVHDLLVNLGHTILVAIVQLEDDMYCFGHIRCKAIVSPSPLLESNIERTPPITARQRKLPALLRKLEIRAGIEMLTTGSTKAKRIMSILHITSAGHG